jgi:hypothetical protein
VKSGTEQKRRRSVAFAKSTDKSFQTSEPNRKRKKIKEKRIIYYKEEQSWDVAINIKHFYHGKKNLKSWGFKL